MRYSPRFTKEIADVIIDLRDNKGYSAALIADHLNKHHQEHCLATRGDFTRNAIIGWCYRMIIEKQLEHIKPRIAADRSREGVQARWNKAEAARRREANKSLALKSFKNPEVEAGTPRAKTTKLWREHRTLAEMTRIEDRDQDGLSILEVGHNQCRWPISADDVDSCDHVFCGKKTAIAEPYCSRHKKIANVPAPVRRQDMSMRRLTITKTI